MKEVHNAWFSVVLRSLHVYMVLVGSEWGETSVGISLLVDVGLEKTNEKISVKILSKTFRVLVKREGN